MTLRLLSEKGKGSAGEVDSWVSLNKTLKAICKKGKIDQV